jgi:hypothetical protein
VSVSPYLPLTELLGGDGPGLGIETKSMLGGTYKQIAAEDPAHFRQSGELASLLFPATDFAAGPTEVSLEIWSRETKTHQYTVTLHYTDDEATGELIFTMLKAKFGEPKKDSKSTDADTTFNFKKNGRNIAARKVSQQWQLTVSK